MRKAITHRVCGAAIALWHAAERAIHRAHSQPSRPEIRITDSKGSATILRGISRALSGNSRLQKRTAVIVFEVDNFRAIEEANCTQSLDFLIDRIASRVRPLLRQGDVSAHLEGARFAIALSPRRRIDLESTLQLSTRIQHALVEPIKLENQNVFVTVSVGISMANRVVEASAAEQLRAAKIALLEASKGGPNAIRSYSSAMHQRLVARGELLNQVHDAIANGEVTAYFQPQIDLTSQRITGLESLARWIHPTRGLIAPADFLPAIEQAGLMRQLGHRILAESLSALSRWDKFGIHVPTVSINLSNAELRNPHLVDHIKMELDRYNLSASRLVIEVLETVVATQDETIIGRNLASLAKLGCGIDLDDFGTGYASITSVRKLAIHRIKIDRSFITNIDRDPEQQNMVAAILTMAERLGLNTLAEGVETPQEQATLSAMGCGHMQGYTLAKPMAFNEIVDWVCEYNGQITVPTRLHQVR